MIHYDKNYFIAKFEAIPVEFWNVGAFRDNDETYKRCALGHCGVTQDRVLGSTNDEARALIELLHPMGRVVDINDGVKHDKLSTPKERILAALRCLP